MQIILQTKTKKKKKPKSGSLTTHLLRTSLSAIQRHKKKHYKQEFQIASVLKMKIIKKNQLII